jgi:cytochrome P450
MALPPGPKTSSFRQTLALVRWPMKFLEECAARYGDIFTLRIRNPGGALRTVMVSHPEAIKQIFTARAEVFHAGEAARPVIGDFVGAHSVLTLDGTEHMRQRKLMLPPFHGERMEAYAVTMRDVARASIATWPRGEPFALHPHMQDITLEIILRTVFGIDDADRMHRLGGQLKRIMNLGTTPFALLPLARVNLGRYSPRARFDRMRAAADASLYEEIDRRRASPNGAHRTDVLALLMSAIHEDGQPMTNLELRDEMMTLMAAGHETTATALAWTFERVLSHRAVHERLRAELRDVVGAGPIAPEHLPQLEYLDATIKEALRLRPVIPNVARIVKIPITLRGYELPVGTLITPSIYLTHRNPEIYPEPARFRPERFLGVKPDPYAWLPFGGGIRRCLGMAFALYEMRIVMATVLLETDLGLARGTTGRMARRGITFAPRDGVQVEQIAAA